MEFRINPAMLALARESRGLTQSQLADALGVAQSTVAKWEAGSMCPASHVVDGLAKVLDYDVCLFQDTSPLHTISTSVLYRQRARVPASTQRRVEAELNIRKMQVARLTRAGGIDDTLPHIPVETFDGNVEEVAREFRRVLRIPDGPLHDLTRTVESAGGVVIQMDFGTRLIDGAHLWLASMPPLFFMSANVPGERYRFSLAHEVGHAVMHRAVASGDLESQAQRFAAELLMPAAQIRRDLRGFDLEVAQRLKRHWKVSMAALIERAWALEIITDAKRSKFYAFLGAKGARVNEPWPLPLEEPLQFSRLVSFHRDSLGMTKDDLRTLLFTERLGQLHEAGAAIDADRLNPVDQGLFAHLTPASPPVSSSRPLRLVGGES